MSSTTARALALAHYWLSKSTETFGVFLVTFSIVMGRHSHASIPSPVGQNPRSTAPLLGAVLNAKRDQGRRTAC